MRLKAALPQTMFLFSCRAISRALVPSK